MSKRIKPIVSSSPSGAALQLVDELENKNITLEEFLGDSLGKTLDEEPVPLVNEADPINEADNYDAIAYLCLRDTACTLSSSSLIVEVKNPGANIGFLPVFFMSAISCSSFKL